MILVLGEKQPERLYMFNKSQIQAISHVGGPALVLAGPGSGKTTVITHRVKNLIEKEKVPGENILVVTFTKAAAVSMEKRFLMLMRECGVKNTGNLVSFGTFHSVFYRILRHSKGYETGDILSERDKSDYIKEIILRHGIYCDDISEMTQNIINEISRVKGNLSEVESYEPECCRKEDFLKVYSDYNEEMKKNGKLDFDDILYKCYAALENDKKMLKFWQNQYKYILIDEFQDINQIQMRIIELLAKPHNNLFVVGDDDQSIYGFRGARPEIIIDFKNKYPDTEQIVLDVNYRSTPEIVEISKKLIKNNQVRLEKSANAAAESGEEPDLRCFGNQLDEFRFVAEKIKEYEKDGIKTSDIAILVRNNSQIPEIIKFFKNKMICTNSKNTRTGIYESMVGKDIMAYIKGALEFDGKRLNENLMYILNKPQRYISRQVVVKQNFVVENIKRFYNEKNQKQYNEKQFYTDKNGDINSEKNIYEDRNNDSYNSSGNVAINNMDKFIFGINMIRKLPPFAAINYIRKGTGYEDYLRNYAIDNNMRVLGLLKQLDEIQKNAAGFSTLESWVKSIEDEYIEKTESVTKENVGVNIMTMHSSKGLEFQVVFILDANQGIIPTSKALRQRDFEEERRLFYVAMTRAIKELNIYSVKERLGCPVQISMFVEELV